MNTITDQLEGLTVQQRLFLVRVIRLKGTDYRQLPKIEQLQIINNITQLPAAVFKGKDDIDSWLFTQKRVRFNPYVDKQVNLGYYQLMEENGYLEWKEYVNYHWNDILLYMAQQKRMIETHHTAYQDKMEQVVTMALNSLKHNQRIYVGTLLKVTDIEQLMLRTGIKQTETTKELIKNYKETHNELVERLEKPIQEAYLLFISNREQDSFNVLAERLNIEQNRKYYHTHKEVAFNYTFYSPIHCYEPLLKKEAGNILQQTLIDQ